jgi:hypothetical protein
VVVVGSASPGGVVEAALPLPPCKVDGGAHHSRSLGRGVIWRGEVKGKRQNPNPRRIWRRNRIGGDGKEGNGQGEEATARWARA